MRASSAAFLLRLFFEAILLPTADALWVTLKRLTERDTLNTCTEVHLYTIYNTIQYNTIQYNTIQYTLDYSLAK